MQLKRSTQNLKTHNEALYRTLLDKTKADLQDEIGQGIKTYAELRTQIRDEAAATKFKAQDEIAFLSNLTVLKIQLLKQLS